MKRTYKMVGGPLAGREMVLDMRNASRMVFPKMNVDGSAWGELCPRFDQVEYVLNERGELVYQHTCEDSPIQDRN